MDSTARYDLQNRKVAYSSLESAYWLLQKADSASLNAELRIRVSEAIELVESVKSDLLDAYPEIDGLDES